MAQKQALAQEQPPDEKPTHAQKPGKANGPAPGEPDPAYLERPRIASDVRVHEPSGEGQPWIIQRGTGGYFRVQADLARLALAVDGTRDHHGLADALGAPWTTGHVDQAVRTLAAARLLDDGVRRPGRDRRVRFVPPLTVQFTLLRPERLLTWLSPLLNRLVRRGVAFAALAVALGGLLALALLTPSLTGALGTPLPLAAYAGVFAGVLVTTAVHEFSHGALLTYYGGRPSRMGVMLFYLSPAFFCDVSDGWRLGRKEQRVLVALAGIAAQTVVAGLAAVSCLFLSASTLRDAVLVFAVASYVSGLVNLLPLVKLDGYIALMTHLDLPHLRDRAMTDGRRFLSRLLFGGRYTRELPGLRWSVAYGLACLAFPLYLVASAVALWAGLLQRLGEFGSAAVCAILGYVGYRLARGAVRLVREARAAGARLWRVALAGVLAAAVVTAALLLVSVPYRLSGGYLTRPDGRIELVLPTSADLGAVHAGEQVVLYRAGVMVQTRTGLATVQDPRATRTEAPVSAFAPVSGDLMSLPASGIALRVDAAPTDRIGVAALDTGRRTLAVWLYDTYLAPAWRW
jgi:putative peptide zinc metalloprotease protein